MGKDPAVLFYTSDFLSGTSFFTKSQRGEYITLLCEQHQLYSIPEEHLIEVCGSLESPVAKKFKKDTDGTWFNIRMREETIKRQKYCDSRRKNINNRYSYGKQPLKNKKVNYMTHIYLIKDNISGFIKIGSSINPKKRLIELQNGKLEKPSKEFDLIIIFESQLVSFKHEYKLQKKFRDKQQFNEWYLLDDLDISFIINYLNSIHMNNDMNIHMENENEDGNTNTIEDENRNEFDRARIEYPGTKRGLKTEYENFKKKHKDYKTIITILYDAIIDQINWRKEMFEADMFVPEWKMFQTWINQRCWEDEKPTIVYKPKRQFGRQEVSNDFLKEQMEIPLS
ncbi:MAG: GIY-YIG nuclease family protein [Desulfobacterales bacterium]